jgi:hypothetical protein
MYNNSAKQSFPLAGRLGPGGQLDLTCRCPPGQAFSIRGTIQPQANAAELRGRMALYAAAGVFGRSEVVLRRAKH